MSAQGRVVWHDLNTTDLDASKRFYGELFGWRFQSEGGWTFLHAGDERDHFGAVMTLERARGLPSHWLPYVAVDDLDAAMGAVGRAGGKLHLGKTPAGPAGKTGNFAVAADSEGAVFTLWQYTGGQPKPESSSPPPPGRFCWDELYTSDPDAAGKFYSQVIGWSTEHMDMPGMRYTLYQRAGKINAAGMMKMPPGVPHPFWLSYVAVADCDASVERARSLGATITSPPMDIPDVGRFSTMLDPTMGAIAVLGPNK